MERPYSRRQSAPVSRLNRLLSHQAWLTLCQHLRPCPTSLLISQHGLNSRTYSKLWKSNIQRKPIGLKKGFRECIQSLGVPLAEYDYPWIQQKFHRRMTNQSAALIASSSVSTRLLYLTSPQRQTRHCRLDCPKSKLVQPIEPPHWLTNKELPVIYNPPRSHR